MRTDNLEKRFVTNDGRMRINIYRDEYARNPRDWTDEPLHCNDWARDYSIMNKDEREYSDARSLIIQMLVYYGKREAIINELCKGIKNNRLEYNRSMKRWELKEYAKYYMDKGYDWYDEEYFDGRKDDIDLGTLLEHCYDSTINELCDEKYWTDGVKIASYGFGYYGELSFYNTFDTNSEGIAWLEKDEFLKYSGQDESYWKGKSLKDIEWLIEELEAWGNGDVYRFVVEEKVVKHIKADYVCQGRTEEYDEEDWEDTDSCCGFYGDLDKIVDDIFDNAGFKKEELTEVKD